MFRTFKVSILAAAVVLLAAGVLGQVPNYLTYQGKLADATGAIVDPVSVTFYIYDVDAGNAPLWSETMMVDPDASGVFTVQLGMTELFPENLFDGSPRYLAIKVGSDDEMTPRQLIGSTPYSLNTAAASGVAHTYISTHDVVAGVSVAGQLTVSVPGPGYLYLQATGWGRIDYSTTTYCYYYVSITEDAASYNDAASGLHYTQALATGGIDYETFSVSDFVPVAAGERTFYITTAKSGADQNADIYRVHFTATFIPAWIGTAPAPTLKASKQNPDFVDQVQLDIERQKTTIDSDQ